MKTSLHQRVSAFISGRFFFGVFWCSFVGNSLLFVCGFFEPPVMTAQQLSRWLGRQVGHVRHALAADVGRKVLYRRKTVQTKRCPKVSNIRLTRTTVDEISVSVRCQTDDGQREG